MTGRQAPFPWFGGKSKVAGIAWERFGEVKNYVEPFFGSGAVLLGRPGVPGTETINDIDGFVANFWRAIAADSAGVSKWADNPVNENDLHARHIWLIDRKADLNARLNADPDFSDARIAGYWVYGMCAWIGSGFCSGNGPWRAIDGILTKGTAGQGINRQLPHLGTAGQGINRQLPHLGTAGQGINRQLPHLGDAGRGINEWFAALSARLRRVRVACGDWARVCGPSVTHKHGLTGVFLDPPYDGFHGVYRNASGSVFTDVVEWCKDNQDNPKMRIAICGYDGSADLPGWDCVSWKARGGFGSQRADKSNENATKERIWFSPHCQRSA